MPGLLSNLRIAIVGAGVAGMSTANALIRLGCRRLALYDRAANAQALRDPATGVIIGANGVRVLNSLGLASPIYSAGQPIKSFIQRNTRNELLASYSPTQFTMGESITVDGKEKRLTTIAVERRVLAEVLMAHLPGDLFHFNHSLSAIHQTDDGYEMKFSGAISSQHADLIIGADGINSTVRSLYVNPPPSSSSPSIPYPPPRSLGGLVVQGLTDEKALDSAPSQTGSKPGRDEMIEIWGNGLRFGSSHVGNGKIWWFATVHQSFASSAQSSPTQFSKSFSSFPPYVASLINSTPTASYFIDPLVDLAPSIPFYRDDICLVGDSIHALTLDLHQQVSQSVESAAALSLSLMAAESPTKAFQRYRSVRYPRVSYLSNASHSESESAIQKSSLMASLRDMATSIMPPQAKLAPIEKALSYNLFDDFKDLSQEDGQLDQNQER